MPKMIIEIPIARKKARHIVKILFLLPSPAGTDRKLVGRGVRVSNHWIGIDHSFIDPTFRSTR